MKRQTRFFRGLVLTASVLAATAASAGTSPGPFNPAKIVEPGQELGGLSYTELVGGWTNWLVKEPIATNPIFDPDGRYCNRNQSGKIWYLASTLDGVATRTCAIPEGKAIFVSLGGAFLTFAPEFPETGDPCLGLSSVIDQLRCELNNGFPVFPEVSLQVTLDGVPVNDLTAYRTLSVPGGFSLNVPNPSLLTDIGYAPGTRTPAVADGYFLLIEPLTPGEHVLRIRMTDGFEPTAKGVDYTLLIGGIGI